MTMEAPEATGLRPSLPAPLPLPAPEPVVDLSESTVARNRRRRRAIVVVLLAWALVLAAELGYVVGRDRTAAREAAPTGAAPGQLVVLQAIARSQEERIAALQADHGHISAELARTQQALAEAQTKPTAPAVVEIPLAALDPVAGQPGAVYAGTLALASCDGFGDASCSGLDQLGFTFGRGVDDSLTISTPLFDATPLGRAGNRLHATGPVTNPTYAVSCDGGAIPTFFDVQLEPDHLVVDNGRTSVGVLRDLHGHGAARRRLRAACASGLHQHHHEELTPPAGARRVDVGSRRRGPPRWGHERRTARRSRA